MPAVLEHVAKEAMDLPPRQRLVLAELLLESADGSVDPDSEAAWEIEIGDRIRALDAGQVKGIAFEEVMKAAEQRLMP